MTRHTTSLVVSQLPLIQYTIPRDNANRKIPPLEAYKTLTIKKTKLNEQQIEHIFVFLQHLRPSQIYVTKKKKRKRKIIPSLPHVCPGPKYLSIENK